MELPRLEPEVAPQAKVPLPQPVSSRILIRPTTFTADHLLAPGGVVVAQVPCRVLEPDLV